MRNSGKVLLGSLLQERGAGRSNGFLCLFLERGKLAPHGGKGKSGSRGQAGGVTEVVRPPL